MASPRLLAVVLACLSCREGGVEASTETASSSDTGSASGSESSDDTDGSGDSTGSVACGEAPELWQWASSGFVIRFEVVDQQAYVWVNSASGITHVEAWLQDPAESLGIPGGPIELDGTYNPGYSYRLDPDAVTFGDIWIEVCDATPCYIEEVGAQQWAQNPGTWCPWGFVPLQVFDCRGHDGAGACPTVFP